VCESYTTSFSCLVTFDYKLLLEQRLKILPCIRVSTSMLQLVTQAESIIVDIHDSLRKDNSSFTCFYSIDFAMSIAVSFYSETMCRLKGADKSL